MVDQSSEGPEAAVDDAVAPNADLSTPADNTDALSSILKVMPRGLVITALWGACLLIIGLAVWGVALLAGRLSEVVLPVFAAFLLTAALQPLRDFLVKRGTPAWLAALICLLFLVVVVGGLMTLVAMQIVANWTELST